jgi:hypothetical protein
LLHTQLLITFFPFDIAAADSAFEDTDDTEYFHVSVSSMLKIPLRMYLSINPLSPDLLLIHYTNEVLLVPERDEQLALYALIARAAVDSTIPYLTQLFSERFARLSQVLSFASSCNLPQLSREKLLHFHTKLSFILYIITL